MTQTSEFLFNPNRITDTKWLIGHLNQINTAVRSDDNIKFHMLTDKNNRLSYLLETDSPQTNESIMNSAHVHSWDFVLPGKNKNTFQVYTINMLYKQSILEGKEMDEWVQQQIRNHPGTTDDDFRFLGIFKTTLNKCTIYQGRDSIFERTFYNVSKPEYSLAAITHHSLSDEIAFQPVKKAFVDLLLPHLNYSKIQQLQKKQMSMER